MNWFRRRAPVADPEKEEVRRQMATNEARLQRLRDEAAIITIHLPRIKRAASNQ